MAAENSTIKYKFLILSVILFLAIFIIGGFAFVISMKEITNSNKNNELQQLIEIERLKLESSVNGEIAIVVKMAGSPIIQRYFLNPLDKDLEKIVLEEIAGYRRAFAGGTVFWVNDIDKKFYSDDAYAFTIDVNDPNNYWYKMTMYETKKFNFNINYNPDLKKIMLWINAPVFDEKGSRKPIGILGTGIDLTAFTNSIYRDYSRSADLYFFNDLGEITGAKDIDVVANKTLISKLFGDMSNDMLNQAKKLSPSQMHSYILQNENIVVGVVPALGWYITAIHKINLADYLKNNMTIIFISIMIVVALIFIIFNVFIGKLMKPLKKMVFKLNEISSNWDLTNSVEVKSKDEMGIMASSFNSLLKALKVPIAESKTVTVSLASASKELSGNSKHLSVSFEEMVSRAANVKSRMERMAANINAMASGAKDASANSSEVAKTAEEMSTNMITIAAAVEEMSASISQIANNATEAHKVSEEATTKSGNATAAMSKLGLAAKEIGQVTDVIKRIADKTNLLALNATIEASWAGEAGKGFAVVAGEIKELANQSSKSADDISRMIDGIQAETSDAIGVIKDVSNIIEKINSSVEAIAEHVSQQTRASNEIANNIAQVNNGAQKVALAIGEVAKGGNEIASNASDAARRVEQVANDVNSMSGVAKESSKEVSYVNSSANNLEKMADNLETVIGKFRV
jgi:methyl-accepting chemotaxis protein